MVVTRRYLLFYGTALALAGCNSGNNNPPCPQGSFGTYPNCYVPPPPPPPPPPPDEWAIGPVIGGVSYSVGMPPNTTGQAFEFPVGPVKHVGYLTRPLSLAGKSKIKLVFEIIGDGPYRAAASPPELTDVGLYFQRQGDDWSGSGPYEGYRWFTIIDRLSPLKAGTWTLEAPLQRSQWTSANANTATEADFQAAMANASAVGFTFGNAGGKGHGVYSEAPGCKFQVISYEIS